MMDERDGLARLDERLTTLLPAEYHTCYEAMQPVPMGAAALQYDAEGRVAWDRIWGSFCDLAMAGGPPHKGRLLRAGTESDINADFARYDAVVEEISRGIRMATGLRAYPSPTPGWVCVTCHGDTMAGWLLRAIVMENVAARCAGSVLELPAAPGFRLEKEVKNVITVIAKTSHYWLGHMPRSQQRAIGDLFMRLAVASPLLEPAWTDGGRAGGGARGREMGARIARRTGLRHAEPQCPDWLGLECPDTRSAVWLMRALVAGNVLARREEQVLFVPINRITDPDGSRVVDAVAGVHRYAMARGVCPEPESARVRGESAPREPSV
jgi:sirohydrochlorin cobaltochelatase